MNKQVGECAGEGSDLAGTLEEYRIKLLHQTSIHGGWQRATTACSVESQLTLSMSTPQEVKFGGWEILVVI